MSKTGPSESRCYAIDEYARLYGRQRAAEHFNLTITTVSTYRAWARRYKTRKEPTPVAPVQVSQPVAPATLPVEQPAPDVQRASVIDGGLMRIRLFAARHWRIAVPVDLTTD